MYCMTHLCSEVLLEVREGKGQDELPTVLHWDNLYAHLHTHSAAHRARAHTLPNVASPEYMKEHWMLHMVSEVRYNSQPTT